MSMRAWTVGAIVVGILVALGALWLADLPDEDGGATFCCREHACECCMHGTDRDARPTKRMKGVP